MPLHLLALLQSSWMWGYSLFAGGVLAISLFRALLFFSASLRAATDIHNAMVLRVRLA